MPDRAVPGLPDRGLGEFFILRLSLLQAGDVRLGFGKPAHQHRKTTIDAVHVKGRYLHLFSLPISERQKSQDSERKARPAFGIIVATWWWDASLLTASRRPRTQIFSSSKSSPANCRL